MALCPEGRTHADCINQHSMSFQEGAQSSVIVTSLRQTFLKGKSSNGTDVHRTDNYLVPAASALSLDILYTLKVGTIEMSSYFDTTTVARKSDGTVWKRFDASNSHVSLTLSELLSLAGVRLEDTMPVVGRNYFPNALDSSGPLARVAGLNLDIEIKCGRKPRAFFWETAALPTEKHPDVECSLQVKTSPSFMVSVVRFESDSVGNLQSGTRVRSYQGVRFTSSFSGKYKRLNLNSVLVNITTAVTFLSIPNQVIFVMAMWFLGHLSRIYRAAVQREFNISKECAAMSMRLIAHSYLFSEVQNQMGKDGKFEEGIIDEASMTQMWTRIIKDHISNPIAAEEMAQFFMHQIVSSFKTPPLSADDYAKRGIRQEMLGLVQDGFNSVLANLDYNRALKKYASGGGDKKLNMENFQAALCSADPISFESLVRLFDQNRPVGRVEQFFTPVQLRICLEKAKHDILVKEQRQKAEVALMSEVLGEDQNMEGEEPHDDYISARYEISVLQEELQFMKQTMSEVEQRLLELKGAFNEGPIAAKYVANARLEPASGFVSRAQFDRHSVQMMNVVDRRFKQLQAEFRAQRDEMRAGMDAVAGSCLRGIGMKEGTRNPHGSGAVTGGITRFAPVSHTSSSWTNQAACPPTETPCASKQSGQTFAGTRP